MNTPVSPTVVVPLLPLLVDFELDEDWLTGEPGLPAATVLLDALYCFEFEYQIPAATMPLPSLMSLICSAEQVSCIARIQQVGAGCLASGEFVCVEFIGPEDLKLERSIGSPVLRSVPSMTRVKTVKAVSG